MIETVTGDIMGDAELHFDPMPDFTAHDFLNTKKPLLWIVSHASEGAYMVKRYSDIVVEAAKQFGINNYRSHYTAFMKVWQKEHKARTDNITSFDNQPMELFCGAFEATDDGVYCYSAYNDRVCACPHPIMPTGRLVDIDTKEVRIEVTFKRGYVWQSVVVDKAVLASAAKIVALASYGIGVDSENARYLVKYFTEAEHLNYAMIPETVSVSRLGWIGDGQFSPYVDGVKFNGNDNHRGIYDAVSECGNPECWISEIGSAMSQNKTVRLYIAASLASALVKPCQALPFIVHLWGGSGAGKTVALMAAASVWADPAEKSGFIQTFNATPVGLEMSASFLNSLPLCLDELQIAKDRRSFDELIYTLTEGIGRIRGAKTGGVQQMRTWRNAILSTGEMPISNASSGAGAMNRVIEIDCKEEKLFEDPQRTVSVVSQNYGYAGRVFVERLSNPENLKLARELQREYYKKLASGDVTEKQALAASLILTADKLADMWIFYSEDNLTAKDIIPYLSTKTEVDVNRRALEWFYGWVAENGNAFLTAGTGYTTDSPRGAVYGRITPKGIAVIKTVFERAMNEAGFNPAAFLSWAKRSDVLTSVNGKNLSTPIRIGESLSRCVVIRPLAEEVPPNVCDFDHELPI